MKRRISKAEAQAFKTRWEAVNAAEREELRATPVAHKLRQLSALVASVGELKWAESLAAGEAEVRERWGRLRRKFRCVGDGTPGSSSGSPS